MNGDDSNALDQDRREDASPGTSPPDGVTTGDPEWLARGERGAMWGIRVVAKMALVLGRWPTRLFLAILAFWYTVFDRPARAGSRLWHERIHEREATFWDAYKHIRRFVNITLDRIFLLSGKHQYFEINRNGNEHLQALADAKKGAILLGAHMGSFEAMRIGGDEEDFLINIVGHFENAKMINSLLTDLNPEIASRVIHVGEDPVGSALTLRERLAEGEMVAILGDRTGINDKTVTVNFLGRPAEFPAGPFLLASILRAPVYLVFGLYFEPNRYELFCEPFVEQIKLPRGNRQGALEETVQRYADRLEHYCRIAPDNWFNFYDFWKSAETTDV